jgi:phospholipase C
MRSIMPVLAALLVASPAFAAKPVTFKHIILVIQENRTPDNLFGSSPNFEPNVDIASQGVNSLGQTVPLTPLPMADCYDVNHAHVSFEAMLNQGADKEGAVPKGVCTIPANPEFKYVDNSTGEVQPYFDIATNYGFANRMFQTNQGASFPAHQFLFAGTSQPSAVSPLFVSSNTNEGGHLAGCTAPAQLTVSLIDGQGSQTSNPAIYPCTEHQALSDLLDAAGLSWHYYAPSANGIWTAPNAITHICQPGYVGTIYECTGPDWANGSVVPTKSGQILTDIEHCKLAAVSWSIPTAAESDHSNSTNGTGPQWVASIVNTLGQQPACKNGENYWADTAIFITWDDWGGWYDHVAPFQINIQPQSAPGWGDGYTYGFRVPLLVVSAYTPNGAVDNTIHDFGSLIYFIEHNFNLGFVGPGNNLYGNYADYQAYLRGDTMAGFFTLAQPKAFVPIPTMMQPNYFVDRPPSNAPVDDD